MVDIQSPTAEISEENKEEEERRNHDMKTYIWPALLHRAAINTC